MFSFRFWDLLTGGIQAYDYEQPKERYPIDFIRAGYFLFLHVVAFACALSGKLIAQARMDALICGSDLDTFRAAFCWLCLRGGPSTFSLPALGLCLSLFVMLQTLGISLSYHRHLTHRSFQCHKSFEILGASLES